MNTQSRDTPAARERRETEILTRLAELGGDQFRDDEIIQDGDRLMVPVGMTLADAARFISRKAQEDEETQGFVRTYPFRPYDGAVTAYNALHSVFGAVIHGSRMFDPAYSITVPTDAEGGTVQVPYGGYFTVPLMPDVQLMFGSTEDEENGTVFLVSASGPRKRRFQIEGLFQVIATALDAASIYRGKAIDGREMPAFLDLSAVDPSKVIYTEDVRTQLEANVWTPIRHAQACRDAGVPLKRAVLVHGPFGTGKTLAAYLTAKIATENGWTFLYARPGRDNLLDVLRTARLYQPAVVFFEDADVIADATREDADGVSILLDAFDGITAKGTEIIAVLTTNYPEKIHKGMVRPGRLDAVVRIAEWDAAGVVQMIRQTVPEAMLAGDLDEGSLGQAFDGFLPAFVREAVDRAVRYALARNNGSPDFTLDAEDFVAAAEGLRPQLELMESAPEHTPRVTVEGIVRRETETAIRAALNPDAIDVRGTPIVAAEERGVLST